MVVLSKEPSREIFVNKINYNCQLIWRRNIRALQSVKKRRAGGESKKLNLDMDCVST